MRGGSTVITIASVLQLYVGSGGYPPASVLWPLLLPYDTGEKSADGSTYSNLYLQLLPYITEELSPDGSTISNLYLQLLPYITGQL
jgi:hypothetical protein